MYILYMYILYMYILYIINHAIIIILFNLIPLFIKMIEMLVKVCLVEAGSLVV